MQNNKTVDVSAVIDSASFFWKPFSIAVMMIIIMLTDGFDLFIPGYVAPALIADWGISRADVQPFIQAGLIGMAIGSVGLGWLGDRIGRKKAYVSCLALMFLGSTYCYFANDVTDLFIGRVVMGLGLGGVTPLATTLVSEWTSKRIRSVVVASVIVAVPLGGSLTGFIDRALVPEYGWRSMFLVGAIAPLVLFVLFSYMLPESPKYMSKHPGLHKRLANSLNWLVGEKRYDGTERFMVVEEGQQSSNWFATIWNVDFRIRTTLIWTAFAVNSFVLYVFTGQLPLLFDAANMSADFSSLSLQFFSGGAVLGSVGGAFLIGLFGSRYVGTGLAAVGGIAIAVIGLVLLASGVSNVQLLALCLIAGASINGMQAFMYAVSAHSYPTEVRGSAIGVAQTFSRIGAIASPWVAGIYFDMDPLPTVSVFFFFMACVICLTVVSFYLIPSHIPRNESDPSDVIEAESLGMSESEFKR